MRPRDDARRIIDEMTAAKDTKRVRGLSLRVWLLFLLSAGAATAAVFVLIQALRSCVQ